MARRRPGERWTCSCGQKLVGARTLAGGVAPITADPKDNGNVWLGRGAERSPCPNADLPWHDADRANCTECRGAGAVREVRSAVLAGPILDHARQQGMALYLNHFADCPNRDRYGPRQEQLA